MHAAHAQKPMTVERLMQRTRIRSDHERSRKHECERDRERANVALGFRNHVTRSRLRQAIHDVDPINTALRWGGTVRSRRPYSVPGPNSLWHIGTCILYMHTHVVVDYNIQLHVQCIYMYLYRMYYVMHNVYV